MATQLIREVRAIDPSIELDQTVDLQVIDGEIAALAPELPHSLDDSADEVIEARGQVLLPGLVDLYSYASEPGYESRETLSQLMQAAKAGGFTRVALAPTTQPPLDMPVAISDLLERQTRILQATGDFNLPRLLPWGALTQACEGTQMSELAELANSGIVGFADGLPIQSSLLRQRLLEYLQPIGKPILLWPCDYTLRNDGVAREGIDAWRYGLSGDPAGSETAALASLLEQARLSHTPVHVAHLSTARSIELVQWAKSQALPVTASTSWMHLLLSTRDLASYDPNLRLSPPLGNPTDQQALTEAIVAGVIDAVSIGHRAFTYEEKTVGFASAPSGVIGLELALSLLWSALVEPGHWRWETLIRALSIHPADILGQPAPSLQVNQPAEMVLFDPSDPWRVEKSQLRTPAQNTPWWGQELTGRVRRCWSPSTPAPRLA